jgi:Cytochrome c554 and c-prime
MLMRDLKHSKQCWLFVLLILVTAFAVTLPMGAAEPAYRIPEYAGSEKCRECHKTEYENFTKFAKKARSFEAVERMQKGLTEVEINGCYHCHTTGYGRPGGFISLELTPSMKNTGCEVCHGPGKTHIMTKSPLDIKKHFKKEDCEVCHTPERVRAFRYKPLIHGYAH